MNKPHQTKLFKTSFALAASALILTRVAMGGESAPVTYTYTFTASAGQSTDLNGSTITIENNDGIFSVLSFDFIDTGESAAGSPFTGDAADTGGSGITGANATTFTGSFDAYGLTGSDGETPYEGIAQGFGGTPEELDIYRAEGTQAIGVWLAPDGFSTLPLLFAGVVALAGTSRFLRPQRSVSRL